MNEAKWPPGRLLELLFIIFITMMIGADDETPSRAILELRSPSHHEVLQTLL